MQKYKNASFNAEIWITTFFTVGGGVLIITLMKLKPSLMWRKNNCDDLTYYMSQLFESFFIFKGLFSHKTLFFDLQSQFLHWFFPLSKKFQNSEIAHLAAIAITYVFNDSINSEMYIIICSTFYDSYSLHLIQACITFISIYSSYCMNSLCLFQYMLVILCIALYGS